MISYFKTDYSAEIKFRETFKDLWLGKDCSPPFGVIPFEF
ncbi:Uncharacterized protein dnm_034730 [Desulfonema magnum]|uniref:Uncharacterized protein n=1 Tax=Desulfonema magnum TaxID=45655 RepID=A0A975BKL0_9BACT|nr:Uncharacterized protein dnm_034730 [Desulfonema magnum]